MRVHFWGTRGSLPASMTFQAVEQKIVKALQAAKGLNFSRDEDILHFVQNSIPFSVRGTFGTNTSCMEISGGDEYVICDAGTGIRDLGNHLAASGSAQNPSVFHIFISHLHWDHIQGFPFFVPAYIPGNRINIYGCHSGLLQAFENQQQSTHFPVNLHEMRAEINFHQLEPEQIVTISGFEVNPFAQQHPGVSFGYSFVKDGKKLVYSTDAEHKSEATTPDYPFINFIRDADLLVFDAQYNLLDAIDSKLNWGHSSNLAGVELAVSAGVKRLCLFHQDPTDDDSVLEDKLAKTRSYHKIYAGSEHQMQIDLAFDGLEIDF